MAKKSARKAVRQPVKKTVKRAASRKASRSVSAKRRTKASARRPAVRPDALMGAVAGAEGREVGHVRLDVGHAGAARVKRLIYPPGFRWSVDMKPLVGTDFCMHAHVGFLVRGEIHIEYPDGCVIEHKAPQVVCIDPGHDGWVVGDEPAVMIEFDFERETVARLGMPGSHSH